MNRVAPLTFLKLGGSLITDKRVPEAPRQDVVERVAREIADARRNRPDLQLVLGHGSGSFGHTAAQRHGTRAGVRGTEQWLGFAQTADAAARLSRLVTAALLQAGVPAWSIQPSVDLRCEDGRLVAGPTQTVALALSRGLVPVVHGDVALDGVRGGTIASTEEIFAWLMQEGLRAQRLILAGEVDGVFTADPQRDANAQRLDKITPANFERVRHLLGSSRGTDVTGGMAAKVTQTLDLVTRHPPLLAIICSGLVAGQLYTLLTRDDAKLGTTLAADDPPVSGNVVPFQYE